MAKTLESVIASLPKAQQAAITEKTNQLIAEGMTLQELRKARARSQQAVGEILHINQTAVSKIGCRTDIDVSTCVLTSRRWVARRIVSPTFPIVRPSKLTSLKNWRKEIRGHRVATLAARSATGRNTKPVLTKRYDTFLLEELRDPELLDNGADIVPVQKLMCSRFIQVTIPNQVIALTS